MVIQKHLDIFIHQCMLFKNMSYIVHSIILVE
jgi:hypothetical protein